MIIKHNILSATIPIVVLAIQGVFAETMVPSAAPSVSTNHPSMSPSMTSHPSISQYPSSEPSVFDRRTFRTQFRFPNRFDRQVFGVFDPNEHSRGFPVYNLFETTRPSQPGFFIGNRESDLIRKTVTIDSFLVNWSTIQSLFGNSDKHVLSAIGNKEFEGDFVRGEMTGPLQTPVGFQGFLFSYFDDETNQTKVQLLPLFEFTIDRLTDLVEDGQRIQNTIDTDQCPDFAERVLQEQNADCIEFLAVRIITPCVDALNANYTSEVAVLEDKLDRTVQGIPEEIENIYQQRAVSIARAVAPCVDSEVSGLERRGCYRDIYEGISVQDVNRVAGAESRISTALTDVDSAFSALCPRVSSEAESCFPCAACSLGDGITCCEDSDCIGSDSGIACVENVCVPDGDIRYTLTWLGTNNLNLTVLNMDNSTIVGADHAGDAVPSSISRNSETVIINRPFAVRGAYHAQVTVEGSPSVLDGWVITVEEFGMGFEFRNPTGGGTDPSFLTHPPTTSPTTSNFPSVSPSSPSVSLVPSSSPSAFPSESAGPSQMPSIGPSRSAWPSVRPSRAQSDRPSVKPSAMPSVMPSVQPSAMPSVKPSAMPSSEPSAEPSVKPSSGPSTNPSSQPSVMPSAKPSSVPSITPSATPSIKPSAKPSDTPSASAIPSYRPTLFGDRI